jgi:hypothetical protein
MAQSFNGIVTQDSQHFLSYFCCQKNKVEKSLLFAHFEKTFNETKKSQIFTDSHQDFSAQLTFSRSQLLLKPQMGPT